MNILAKIITHKKQEVKNLRKKVPLAGFKRSLKTSQRDFKKAITKSVGINLIAECKKASPSTGVISKDFNIDKIIKIYNKYASAISIVTDEKFFSGSTEDFKKIRSLTDLPILRKDFIVDEYQIYEARNMGADAILLIASILSKEQIDYFIDISKQYNMDCVVEVHSVNDLVKTMETKAKIIMINNRNLRNFKIDLNTTSRIVKYIHQHDKILISASGISNLNDILKLKRDVNAFLVGTALIKNKHTEESLVDLLKPQVKICGVKTFIHTKSAIKAGADFIGFSFVNNDKNYIKPKHAKEIIFKIRKEFSNIKIVGIFKDEKIEKINTIVKYLGLDFTQLDGKESNTFCKKVVCPVIKTIFFKKRVNINKLNKYKKNIASFLLQPDLKYTKNVNWESLKDISNKYQIILSGGLNEQNIKKAINVVQPQVVDVCSGVEDERGDKNIFKIKEFISLVKK